MEDPELVRKIADKRLEGIEVHKPFYKSTLGLPNYFKFGFELEALMDHWPLIRDMREYKKQTLFNNNTFIGVEETTIEYEENQYGGLDYSRGAEIVTPILEDSEETWRDILLACDYLRKHARCTENCSVHINVGAQALGNSYHNWYNFLRVLGACEPEIFKYFADGKNIRSHAISGGFRNGYAMPVANYIRDGLKKCDEEQIADINTLLKYCSFNGDYQVKKDKSVSFKALYQNDNEIIPAEKLDEPAYGRRIEIRMPNGTFNPILIQNYTYVACRLFEVARNLTPEQNKKINSLLQSSIPKNYNEPVNLARALDVANLLFDNREDKLQFLYTICGYKKLDTVLNEKTQILELIKKDNMILELVPDEFKNNREIVLEAVRHSGGELKFASEQLRDDEEIVLAAIEKYGRALEYASPRLKEKRELIMQAVKSNGFALQFVGDKFKNDRELAFEAVKSKAYAIQYISNRLKADKEIAEEAIRKDGLSAQFIDSTLQADKDIGLLAVGDNKHAIYYLDESLMLDKDVLSVLYDRNKYVLEFLKTGHSTHENEFIDYCTEDNIFYKYLLKETMDGNKKAEEYFLKVFSGFCKKSREYGNHEAMNKYDAVQEYVLKKVNNDANYDLLFKLLEIDGYILEHLTDKQRNDSLFAKKAIKNTPLSIEFAGPDIQQNRDIILEAVKKDGRAIEYASDELKADKEVVLTAVSSVGSSIKYVSAELKIDIDVAIAAIRNNSNAIYCIDKKLFDNKQIAIEIVKQEPTYLENLKKEFQDDEDIVSTAIHQKAYVIQYASKRLKERKRIALEVVNTNGYCLRYLNAKFRADKDIVLAAMRNFKDAIEFASPELQSKKEELLEIIRQEEATKNETEKDR